jgi:hypothetical protein
MNLDQHRKIEARLITTAITLVCAVGFASAVVPGVEQAITTIVVIAAGLALTVLVGRAVVRRVRERREDRADALTAAAWQAHHAPHLLTAVSSGARDGRAA